MGEGFEVLLWLAIMAFIGLRGAIQKSRAQQRKRDARVVEEARDRSIELSQASGPGRRPGESRLPSLRPAGVSESARSAEAASSAPRRGVLSRLNEFAAELERQMREAQEAEQRNRAEQQARAERQARAGRPTRGAQPSRPPTADSEQTVVVPGRRVYPAAAPGGPEGHEAHWDDWETSPESHRLHPEEAARRRTRQAGARRVPTPEVRRDVVRGRVPRGDGLSRLDRFESLQRAVILADILGPPPGLDGTLSVERRLREHP